jgi:hypothetical protein
LFCFSLLGTNGREEEEGTGGSEGRTKGRVQGMQVALWQWRNSGSLPTMWRRGTSRKAKSANKSVKRSPSRPGGDEVHSPESD